jgi:hypothetical protein
VTREEKLIAEGWRKQATCDEPRLSEMVHMYLETGKEVLLEPFDPKAEKDCRGCQAAYPGLFRTIYTRTREESS